MMRVEHEEPGRVERVSGPVIAARGLPSVRLHDVVRVGEARLTGEVIRLERDLAIVQVYEETSGLRVGERVVATGSPLEVELGPGLLGSVFDGIQRPLPALALGESGPDANPFIVRGVDRPALARDRKWTFEPSVRVGDPVTDGDILGTVRETRALVHRILVPTGTGRGIVTQLRDGSVGVDEVVAWIDGRPVSMISRWPVRKRRPFLRRLEPETPLVTGQRVIDVLFPVARGGAATIPGGFGTGKTVLEQALAKWAAVDVVVYVACGERGNELTEVLDDFPRARDPRTGASLLDRTIMIANTSNMPVAAREASIYTGMAIAEYYRDQGYDVALMADSTSRWGEALREISGRLEEMPGEEGYPAYLAARLAEFYERASVIETTGTKPRRGSVTVVGAVSPPGGDLSEPMTQHSLRLAGTFWALDTDLARRRHFPAINWTKSYALYEVSPWFAREVAADWDALRAWALELLQKEASLLEIVQLLGAEALAPSQRIVLVTGRMLREDFLQQSAFDEVDAHCPLAKQRSMLMVIQHAHRSLDRAVVQGASLERIASLRFPGEIARMRSWPGSEAADRAQRLIGFIDEEILGLAPRRGNENGPA